MDFQTLRGILHLYYTKMPVTPSPLRTPLSALRFSTRPEAEATHPKKQIQGLGLTVLPPSCKEITRHTSSVLENVEKLQTQEVEFSLHWLSGSSEHSWM